MLVGRKNICGESRLVDCKEKMVIVLDVDMILYTKVEEAGMITFDDCKYFIIFSQLSVKELSEIRNL